MAKELVEIVRCKDCIHRPIKFDEGYIHDRGWDDYTCPCLNEDDYWYSWYPSDDWFCAREKIKKTFESALVWDNFILFDEMVKAIQSRK